MAYYEGDGVDNTNENENDIGNLQVVRGCVKKRAAK